MGLESNVAGVENDLDGGNYLLGGWLFMNRKAGSYANMGKIWLSI